MTINQRKKGHDFERKIARKLQEDLGLIKPVRRILNQYQEKNHPDLKLGRWNIECKAYKKGFDKLIKNLRDPIIVILIVALFVTLLLAVLGAGFLGATIRPKI